MLLHPPAPPPSGRAALSLQGATPTSGTTVWGVRAGPAAVRRGAPEGGAGAPHGHGPGAAIGNGWRQGREKEQQLEQIREQGQRQGQKYDKVQEQGAKAAAEVL